MDAWFPKDCRQEYARRRARIWIILVLVVICFVIFGLAQTAWGQESALLLWVAGAVLTILIIVGSFMYRCPACGSGLFVYGNRCPTWSDGYLRREIGYCHGCGSRLGDARPPAGEYSLVPYVPDSTLGDGRAFMKIIEDTPERFRFRLKRGVLLPTISCLAGLGALCFQGSWAWVVTGFLWLIVLGFVLKRPDEFVFDRSRRRFQIIRRGMSQARILEYPLEDIEQFGLTQSTDLVSTEGSDIQYFDVYSIGMRLQSGVVVSLDTPGAARNINAVGASSRYPKKRAVANRLEQYRRSLVADESFAATGQEKLCAVCGASCAEDARYRDAENRYYHQRCYDAQTRPS